MCLSVCVLCVRQEEEDDKMRKSVGRKSEVKRFRRRVAVWVRDQEKNEESTNNKTNTRREKKAEAVQERHELSLSLSRFALLACLSCVFTTPKVLAGVVCCDLIVSCAL